MMQSIRFLFLPAHILILLFVFLPAPVIEYQIEIGSKYENKKRVKIVFKKVSIKISPVTWKVLLSSPVNLKRITLPFLFCGWNVFQPFLSFSLSHALCLFLFLDFSEPPWIFGVTLFKAWHWHLALKNMCTEIGMNRWWKIKQGHCHQPCITSCESEDYGKWKWA